MGASSRKHSPRNVLEERARLLEVTDRCGGNRTDRAGAAELIAQEAAVITFVAQYRAAVDEIVAREVLDDSSPVELLYDDGAAMLTYLGG